MTNATGKMITGYGSLLDYGTTLNNNGEVTAQGGALAIGGNVVNAGLVLASGTNTLQLSGSLTNNPLGTVRAADGTSISLGEVTNNGTIEVTNGGGGGGITLGSASGDGTYSLEQGRLFVHQNLDLSQYAVLQDNYVSSTIEVIGNLSKAQGAMSEFDADHIDMKVYNPFPLGFPHQILWRAQDKEARAIGLLDNLALGHFTLGDNVGQKLSDQFKMVDDTIIYCYGLTLNTDADVDLGGGIIYYLRNGVTYNGITGTGFDDLGHYSNGQIIEIVPEPASLVCLAAAAALLLSTRRRRTPP